MIPKLTKEQAIVITGYTKIVCCDFGEFHRDVEQRLGRSIWTHQMAEKAVWEEIKAAYRDDFLAMAHDPKGI